MLIDQTAFRSNHPAIARDLLNLAQLLSNQEKFEEAVPLLERAMSITEASFGPTHRETVLCLKELGRALKGAGDATRAVDCMMRISTIMGKPVDRKLNETVVGDEGMLA
jgi:tetratricopeptide (TPR) repeat protein